MIGISTRCKLSNCEILLIGKLGQKQKRGAPSKANKALMV